MAQSLRLNSTDQRITYSPGWATKMDQNGSYSQGYLVGAQLFLLFRGTSVRFYGRFTGNGQFQIDVNNTFVTGETNFYDGPTLVWGADNLGDGDHQLWVSVDSLPKNGTLTVDYLELENSSGNGFDPLWAGPNATNVPKEAIIVDNSSPNIVFSNSSTWFTARDAVSYGGSSLYTDQPGALLNFSFDGVGIWYYSYVDGYHSFYTVSIDGSNPERLNGGNGRKNGQPLAQEMLWSKTDLTPGTHTLTLINEPLINQDPNSTTLELDFFRVLRANASSSTPGSKSNVVPLAVGLTLGLLTLVIAILYLWRRKLAPVEPLSPASLKP